MRHHVVYATVGIVPKPTNDCQWDYFSNHNILVCCCDKVCSLAQRSGEIFGSYLLSIGTVTLGRSGAETVLVLCSPRRISSSRAPTNDYGSVHMVFDQASAMDSIEREMGMT